MLSPEQFTALKAQVDEYRKQRDQAAGALKEQVKQLKQQFGVSTPTEAQALLGKLDRQIVVLEKKLTKALKALEITNEKLNQDKIEKWKV